MVSAGLGKKASCFQLLHNMSEVPSSISLEPGAYIPKAKTIIYDYVLVFHGGWKDGIMNF